MLVIGCTGYPWSVNGTHSCCWRTPGPLGADYLDLEAMNLTSRLEHLFPFLDVRPTDGKISVEELSSWQMAQERKTSLHRTMREMEVMDRNGDGHVSIKEYLNDESPGDTCKETLC